MSGRFLNQKSRNPAHELSQTERCDSCEITNGSSSDETTAFPFKITPSGHLTVIPEQVVYESRQLSIVAANPKRTKVKIKSDNNKEMSGIEKKTLGPDMPSLQSRAFQLPHRQADGDGPSNVDFPIEHRRQENVTMDKKQAPQNNTRLHREIKLEKMGFNQDPCIDWSKTSLPAKTDFQKILHYRISNGINPDFLVKIGNEEFACHLLVLQCYSEYFLEETVSPVELPEESVSASAFTHIYYWMIHLGGDSYKLLRRDNVLEIFMAAQCLQIKELEEQCWAFVDNKDLFSEDKAFMLYLDARDLNIRPIMEQMVPRIQRFFLTLVASKDFLELVFDEIIIFLKSNYICIHCEMEVFMSAVRWLTFDWEKRQKYLVEVMDCVRFGLISPWQLVDIRRNPENQEFLQVTRNTDVSRMIEDGLAYAIVKSWCGQEPSDYTNSIEVFGLFEPDARNWAGTSDIDDQKKYNTYQEFLVDLSKYRQAQILSNRGNGERPSTSSESLPTEYERSHKQTNPTDFIDPHQR